MSDRPQLLPVTPKDRLASWLPGGADMDAVAVFLDELQ
jgi:hypothetical protein